MERNQPEQVVESRHANLSVEAAGLVEALKRREVGVRLLADRWVRIATCALSAMLVTATANADEVISTTANYYVQTASGAPEICGIEATIIFWNMTDRAGQTFPISTVNLGLNWNEVKGNIGLMYKIGGFDVNSLDGKIPPSPYPIAYSDISSPQAGTPKAHARLDCIGQPGWFCSVYWMPASVALFTERFLTIRVTRAVSGTPLDVSLPLVLLPSDDKSVQVNMSGFADFNRCFAAISQRAKDHLHEQLQRQR
jgi:hypothetical protein